MEGILETAYNTFSHRASSSSDHPEKARVECLQVEQTTTREEMSGGRFGGQPGLGPSSNRPLQRKECSLTC